MPQVICPPSAVHNWASEVEAASDPTVADAELASARITIGISRARGQRTPASSHALARMRLQAARPVNGLSPSRHGANLADKMRRGGSPSAGERSDRPDRE